MVPDQSASAASGGFWRRAFAPRRVLLNLALFLYCLGLYLAFDFAYSTFTRGEEQARLARIYDPVLFWLYL